MLGGASWPNCRGGLVITDGGVPSAAVGCCALAAVPSAAAATLPAAPRMTARLDAPLLPVMSFSSPFVKCSYFQLARKNRGSSSG